MKSVDNGRWFVSGYLESPIFSGVIQLVHGEYDEFGESMAEFLDDHLMKVSDLFLGKIVLPDMKFPLA